MPALFDTSSRCPDYGTDFTVTFLTGELNDSVGYCLCLSRWSARHRCFRRLSKNYPDLTGIWSTDNQQAAFAKTHPRLGDKLITAQQEFEIYRQEGSLLWAENRWRKDSSAGWNIEYASGAFMPDSNDEFVFAEIGPPPPDGSATHTVFGEFEDGELHLTGVGNGVAFHSILRRQPR